MSAEALPRASCAPKFWHFPTADHVWLSNIACAPHGSAKTHNRRRTQSSSFAITKAHKICSAECVRCVYKNEMLLWQRQQHHHRLCHRSPSRVQLLIKIKNIFFELRTFRIYSLLFFVWCAFHMKCEQIHCAIVGRLKSEKKMNASIDSVLHTPTESQRKIMYMISECIIVPVNGDGAGKSIQMQIHRTANNDSFIQILSVSMVFALILNPRLNNVSFFFSSFYL